MFLKQQLYAALLTFANMDYKMILSAYIAKDGLLEPLLKELNDPQAVIKENLVLSTKPFAPLYFMQNGWEDPKILKINSINDGINQLKALHLFWSFYPIGFFRRGELILSGLKYPKKSPIIFTNPLPKHPIGGFTLLDANTILASKKTTSPYQNGEVILEENKIPPSRAYLKLEESLHLMQKFPKKGERCLEIGAAPGSWTYILSELGADVIACDRAPLDNKLKKFPNIKFIQGDAFKLTEEKIGKIDWLFSDLICYPEKLYSYLIPWIENKSCKNFVCTLKFQGEIDFNIIKEFEKIPGGKIVHLYNNKHELTFLKD